MKKIILVYLLSNENKKERFQVFNSEGCETYEIENFEQVVENLLLSHDVFFHTDTYTKVTPRAARIADRCFKIKDFTNSKDKDVIFEALSKEKAITHCKALHYLNSLATQQSPKHQFTANVSTLVWTLFPNFTSYKKELSFDDLIHHSFKALIPEYVQLRNKWEKDKASSQDDFRFTEENLVYTFGRGRGGAAVYNKAIKNGKLGDSHTAFEFDIFSFYPAVMLCAPDSVIPQELKKRVGFYYQKRSSTNCEIIKTAYKILLTRLYGLMGTKGKGEVCLNINAVNFIVFNAQAFSYFFISRLGNLRNNLAVFQTDGGLIYFDDNVKCLSKDVVQKSLHLTFSEVCSSLTRLELNCSHLKLICCKKDELSTFVYTLSINDRFYLSDKGEFLSGKGNFKNPSIKYKGYANAVSLRYFSHRPFEEAPLEGTTLECPIIPPQEPINLVGFYEKLTSFLHCQTFVCNVVEEVNAHEKDPNSYISVPPAFKFKINAKLRCTTACSFHGGWESKQIMLKKINELILNEQDPIKLAQLNIKKEQLVEKLKRGNKLGLVSITVHSENNITIHCLHKRCSKGIRNRFWATLNASIAKILGMEQLAEWSKVEERLATLQDIRLKEGHFYVIGGRPGVGKTSGVIRLVSERPNEKFVVIVPLLANVDEVLNRLIKEGGVKPSSVATYTSRNAKSTDLSELASTRCIVITSAYLAACGHTFEMYEIVKSGIFKDRVVIIDEAVDAVSRPIYIPKSILTLNDTASNSNDFKPEHNGRDRFEVKNVVFKVKNKIFQPVYSLNPGSLGNTPKHTCLKVSEKCYSYRIGNLNVKVVRNTDEIEESSGVDREYLNAIKEGIRHSPLCVLYHQGVVREGELLTIEDINKAAMCKDEWSKIKIVSNTAIYSEHFKFYDLKGIINVSRDSKCVLALTATPTKVAINAFKFIAKLSNKAVKAYRVLKGELIPRSEYVLCLNRDISGDHNHLIGTKKIALLTKEMRGEKTNLTENEVLNALGVDLDVPDFDVPFKAYKGGFLPSLRNLINKYSMYRTATFKGLALAFFTNERKAKEVYASSTCIGPFIKLCLENSIVEFDCYSTKSLIDAHHNKCYIGSAHAAHSKGWNGHGISYILCPLDIHLPTVVTLGESLFDSNVNNGSLTISTVVQILGRSRDRAYPLVAILDKYFPNLVTCQFAVKVLEKYFRSEVEEYINVVDARTQPFKWTLIKDSHNKLWVEQAANVLRHIGFEEKYVKYNRESIKGEVGKLFVLADNIISSENEPISFTNLLRKLGRPTLTEEAKGRLLEYLIEKYPLTLKYRKKIKEKAFCSGVVKSLFMKHGNKPWAKIKKVIARYPREIREAVKVLTLKNILPKSHLKTSNSTEKTKQK